MFGLKKTHDVGKDKRIVDDAVARSKAFAQEKINKNDAAAMTRTVNTLENFQKGAQVVGERVSGTASAFFAVGKDVCENALLVVDDKIKLSNQR